jgi:hypothetical protein
MLTKEQILGNKLKVLKVDVPEWGGEVCVRELTAKEQDDINQIVNKGETISNSKLAQMVLCDENGVQLFTDKELAELEKLSGNVLGRVLIASAKLSGADENTIQELQKN